MSTNPRVGTELTDGDLRDEIELVGDLVVAASASEGPLSDDEIDEVLGLAKPHHVPCDESRKPSKRHWVTHKS